MNAKEPSSKQILGDIFGITDGESRLTGLIDSLDAWARGAQSQRENSQHPKGQLEGFIPVVEDWHAKVCLMEVCS